MKKVISLFLTCAMLFVLLTACGNDNSNKPIESDPVNTGNQGESEAYEYPKIKLIASDFTAADSSGGIATKFFIDEVTEQSGGQITFTEYWNGNYANTMAAYEAISTGQADCGSIATLLNPTEFPLTQITMAVPFGLTEGSKTSAAMNQLMAKHADAFEKEYSNAGVVCLYMKGMESYNLLSAKKVETVDDLKGLLVSCTGVYSPAWFEAVGAITVAGTSSDSYQNIKNHVIESVYAFDSAHNIYSLYEVTDYVVTFNGGARCPQGVFFNKEKFDSFDEKTQALLKECAAAACEKYNAWIAEQIVAERKTLTDNGVEVIEFSEDETAKWADAIFAAEENSIEKWIAAANAAGHNGEAIMNDYLAIVKELGGYLPYEIN